jgi:RES domain-containing protein
MPARVYRVCREVPSAVIPAEFNYVLNPRHPEFARIAIEQIKPFVFDPRLF